MRVWLAVLVLAACGRIGFDPVGGATGGDDDASGSGSGSDAGSGSASCGAACLTAGGTCMGSTCVIDVTAGGTVRCPPGLVCVINCNTATACSGGTVDCTMATCTINCKAGGSCTNETFACGGGSCAVYCRVDNTCNGDMFQCASATCDLECCNANGVCGGNSGTVPNFGPCP